jgi:hypothetical protein
MGCCLALHRSAHSHHVPIQSPFSTQSPCSCPVTIQHTVTVQHTVTMFLSSHHSPVQSPFTLTCTIAPRSYCCFSIYDNSTPFQSYSELLRVEPSLPQHNITNSRLPVVYRDGTNWPQKVSESEVTKHRLFSYKHLISKNGTWEHNVSSTFENLKISQTNSIYKVPSE